MSNEFRTHHTATGATVYAVLVQGSSGQVYNGSTYENPLTANWSTYKITCTEQSTTQLYYGSMPAAQAAGLYDVLFYVQSGGSPAPTDAYLERRTLDWKGAAAASLGLFTTGNTETLSLKTLNIVNSTGDAITASATGSNGHGINASGNGSGHGLKSQGGNTTGNGLRLIGGASSGQGILITTTSGDAVSFQPTAGHGMTITGQGTASHGLNISGGGNGHGILTKSGTNVSGDGFNCQSAASNGHGFSATGTGSGDGFLITAGATGDALMLMGGSVSGNGLNTAATVGSGFNLTGGTTSGNGLKITSTLGSALRVQATNGIALDLAAGGNNAGLSVGGAGTGSGALFMGGSNTGADGIQVTTGSPNGNALSLIGNGTGAGLLATNGGTGDGIKCLAGSGGADLRANITGDLSGSVASVTAAVNADLVAAGMDNVTIETGLNARQALSIIAAACAGTLAGASGPTVTIAGAGVAASRIVASVDAAGDRLSVSLNLP